MQKELKSKTKQKLMSNFLPECNCEDSNEWNKLPNSAFDNPSPDSLSSQLNVFLKDTLNFKMLCVYVHTYFYIYSIYRENIYIKSINLKVNGVLFAFILEMLDEVVQ